MAKQFYDVSVLDIGKVDSSYAPADGTALTLTNHVRVLVDDTIEHYRIADTLERIAQRIREKGGIQ